MFSGKSNELIKRLRRASFAGASVVIFKPSIDSRTENIIASRDGSSLTARALKVDSWREAVQEFLDSGASVIGIDECQFISENILFPAVQNGLAAGISFIIAGLTRDYAGNPFGSMPRLLYLADEIHQCFAACNECFRDATRTFRKSSIKDQIVVGSSEYEALCSDCWEEKMHERK
jgi:thymidine kinase